MNTSAATGVWADSRVGDDGFLEAGSLGQQQQGLIRVKFLPPFHECPHAGVAPTIVSVVPWGAGEEELLI